MAISKTASITFEGDAEATCHLHFAGSLAAVATFAAVLQQYSVADVTAYSYTEEQTEPGLTAATGTESVAFQAIVKMRKPSGATGTQQIAIPAPAPSIFTLIPERGYHLNQAVGEAIAAAYSTLMGETYVYLDGWLTS